MIVIVRSPVVASTWVKPRRCGRSRRAAWTREAVVVRARREVGGDRVGAERGEEERGAGELPELHRGDRAAAARGGEPLARVDDLAGVRQAVDDGELDVLDVPDDADRRRHPAGGRTSAAPFWRSHRRGSR